MSTPCVPISCLSPYNPPRPNRFVAVLKGYLDDSGKDAEGYCVFAGYVAEEGAWKDFEANWGGVLAKYGAPYLHMKEAKKELRCHMKEAKKELRCPGSTVYAGWDVEKFDDFLREAASTTGKSDLYGLGAVVPLADVAEFNSCHSQALDPYALCLYFCSHETYARFRDETVTIWIDRIEKPCKRIELAEDYAGTGHVSGRIAMLTIPKNERAANFLPMQAADYAAHQGLSYNKDRVLSFDAPAPAKHKWFSNLLAAQHLNGSVWNLEMLCKLDAARGGIWTSEQYAAEPPAQKAARIRRLF